VYIGVCDVALLILKLNDKQACEAELRHRQQTISNQARTS